MHVDVTGIGIVERACHLFRPQHGQQGQCFFHGNATQMRALAVQGVPFGLQLRFLPGRGNDERAARREQGMLGKPFRRVFEKGAAGAGEGAHLRRTVALHEQGRRAAGGVVAGLRFALQQQHACMRCQPVRGRSAGNACADDDDVSSL